MPSYLRRRHLPTRIHRSLFYRYSTANDIPGYIVAALATFRDTSLSVLLSFSVRRLFPDNGSSTWWPGPSLFQIRYRLSTRGHAKREITTNIRIDKYSDRTSTLFINYVARPSISVKKKERRKEKERAKFISYLFLAVNHHNIVSDTRLYRIVDRGDLSWRRNSTQYDTRLFALVITRKTYVFRGEVNSRLIYRFTTLDTCVTYACNDREQRASRLDGKRETSLWPLELRSLNLIVVVCTCERAVTRLCTWRSYYTRANLRVVQLVITICFRDDTFVCLCKAYNPWEFGTTISSQISVIYEYIHSSTLKYVGIVPTRVKD